MPVFRHYDKCRQMEMLNGSLWYICAVPCGYPAFRRRGEGPPPPSPSAQATPRVGGSGLLPPPTKELCGGGGQTADVARAVCPALTDGEATVRTAHPVAQGAEPAPYYRKRENPVNVAILTPQEGPGNAMTKMSAYTKEQYCKIHGYDFIFDTSAYAANHTRHATWNRVPSVQVALCAMSSSHSVAACPPPVCLPRILPAPPPCGV